MKCAILPLVSEAYRRVKRCMRPVVRRRRSHLEHGGETHLPEQPRRHCERFSGEPPRPRPEHQTARRPHIAPTIAVMNNGPRAHPHEGVPDTSETSWEGRFPNRPAVRSLAREKGASRGHSSAIWKSPFPVLRDDRFRDFAVHVRQAEWAASIAIRELLVVEAE